MCSLAPRAAAPGLGAATAFLDRRRGVAAVAPATHRVDAAPSQKRGHDDVDAASSALRVRMDKELVALQGLLKRAKLLPRSGPPAEMKYAQPPPRQSEAQSKVSSAAKTTTSQPKAATEAADAPAKQQCPVQRAAAKNPTVPEVPNKKQRPAEAPAAAKHQQRPVHRAATKTEAPKKRRPEEELACAAAREEFRQMLLEMEKTALPDETIYPEDLQELGIALEHVVTRTRKEAGMA